MIVILSILALFLAGMTCLLIAFLRKVQAAEAAFRAFILPPEEGKASPFAAWWEASSSILARAIVVQARATLMAQGSAMVRGEKAIEGDIAEDVARTNPVISGLLDNFPTLRRSLRRNPALAGMATEALASLVGGKKAPDNGAVAPSNQSAFSI